jgi:O-antigen/teichoic acid export membrane protein
MNLFHASSRATALRLGSVGAWGLVGIITARTLSVSDRGVYAASVLIAELGATVAGSVAAGCMQQIATGRGSTTTVLRSGLTLALLVGASLFVLTVAVSFSWPSGERLTVLLVGSLFLPGITRAVLAGVLVANGAVGPGQVVANSGVFVGLVLLSAWFLGHGERSVDAALVVWTSAQYAGALIGGAFCARWLFGRGTPMPGLVRHIVTFGTVAGMAGVVGLVQRRVDLLLVAALNGSRGAGLYSTATALSELLLIVPAAIAVAAVWEFGKGTDDEVRQLLARCSRQAVLLGALGALAIVAVGPLALRVAFGAAYRDAATPLRILAISAVLITPQSLVTTFLYIRLGRPVVALLLVSGAAVVEVVLAASLVPSMGLVGAALSNGAAYAVEAFCLTLALRRYADLGWREVWLPRVGDALVVPRSVRRAVLARRGSHQGASASGS